MHLAGSQRESKAFRLDRAPGADLFGLRYLLHGSSGRRDGKEQVRIAGPAGGGKPPVPRHSQHAFLLGAISLARHVVMVAARPATGIVNADDFSRPGHFGAAEQMGAGVPSGRQNPHGADERRSWP
jgi:hypothetical protein